MYLGDNAYERASHCSMRERMVLPTSLSTVSKNMKTINLEQNEVSLTFIFVATDEVCKPAEARERMILPPRWATMLALHELIPERGEV